MAEIYVKSQKHLRKLLVGKTIKGVKFEPDSGHDSGGDYVILRLDNGAEITFGFYTFYDATPRVTARLRKTMAKINAKKYAENKKKKAERLEAHLTREIEPVFEPFNIGEILKKYKESLAN